jgi:hypothetical protein
MNTEKTLDIAMKDFRETVQQLVIKLERSTRIMSDIWELYIALESTLFNAYILV